MAEQIPQSNAKNPSNTPPEETSCFSFLKKKEDKTEDNDVVLTDIPAADKEEKPTLNHELQRNHSLSSSSDEEVEEGGERKKKKGLLKEGENGGTPMEEEEKHKGFVEKIKEKLPGHKDEEIQTPPELSDNRSDGKDKKGIMEKIKEKLPGQGHSVSKNE